MRAAKLCHAVAQLSTGDSESYADEVTAAATESSVAPGAAATASSARAAHRDCAQHSRSNIPVHGDTQGTEQGDVNMEKKLSVDPIAEAFARDAPLTLTAREDLRVVGRIPLRFKEMMPVIHRQLAYRLRQAAHQLSVEPDRSLPGSTVLQPSPPAQLDEDSATEPPHHRGAQLSEFVVRLLPVAVGDMRECKTAIMHPSDDVDDADGAVHEACEQESPSPPPRPGSVEAGNGSTTPHDQAPLEQENIFRCQALEQLLNYFFPPPTAVAHNREEIRDEVCQKFTVASCLEGLRCVRPDTAEYVELLHRLALVAESRRAAPSQSAMAATDDDRQETFVDLPAYARQLLVGVPLTLSSSHTSGNSCAGQPGEIDAVNGSAGAGVVSVVERTPIVTSTLRAALDAVLPPRLFVYYAIDQDTAVGVQQQRRVALHREARLREHLKEHPDDKSSAVELHQLGTALAEEFPEIQVGAVYILLERTSDVQAPRSYLEKLEQSLEEILKAVQARCCGRPLRFARSRAVTQQQQQHASPLTANSAETGETPRKTVRGTASTAPAKDAKTTAALSTVIVATPDKPICTSTLRPWPAQPAATSISGGGSATVAATLNVLELNKERAIVQLHLLGEELLRQVTVDLPERGVLLRHLLDEAQLSLDARAVLARERIKETQEHLLDGQDAREATAAQCSAVSEEVTRLQARLAYLKTRKSSLEALVEEQKAREATATRERVNFETALRERLVAQTEKVRAEQDAARRGSQAG